MNQATKNGIIRPKSGGRPRAAKMSGETIQQASVPLWEDIWYEDTIEELLRSDPYSAERASKLKAQGEWKFVETSRRRTFLQDCNDPQTGESLRYHATTSPPPPQHVPVLYEGERGERLQKAMKRGPVAFCRRCRMWIDQENGETF